MLYQARKLIFICSLNLFLGFSAQSSPLEPVKLDHPRDTMTSFIMAMNSYRKYKLQKNKEQAQLSLSKATRTLNIPPLDYAQRFQKAILLKEIIDRVIVINLNLIPEDPHLSSWRLKGTEIYISKVSEGDRKGQFLFSKETIRRLSEFYSLVKHLGYLEGSGQGALYKPPLAQQYLPEWSKESALGLPLWKWIFILLVFALGNVIRFFFQNILLFFEKWSPKTKDNFRKTIFHYLQKPLSWISASLLWLLCIELLQLDGIWLTLLNMAIKLTLSFSLIWASYNLINILGILLKKISSQTETSLDDKLYPFLLKSLRIFVVVFGTLMTLQNMGLNIFSILTGLGIGGLALALAAKDTAANFFGSLMILVDHPFSAGDWIKTGSTEGTVEDIGLRSTKVRTFYDSIVTVPNSEIASLPIDNMGKRKMRRIKTTLGLTYDTPPEKLEVFIKKLKDLILAHPSSYKGSCHVVFTNYGAYSLDILLYFFLITKSWEEELKEKQNIFMSILKLAHKEQISFAFPTQTVHLENTLPKT